MNRKIYAPGSSDGSWDLQKRPMDGFCAGAGVKVAFGTTARAGPIMASPV